MRFPGVPCLGSLWRSFSGSLLTSFPAYPLTRGPAIPLPHNAAFEQTPPLGADGSRIPQEFLVHGLREPRVGRLEHVRIHEPHPN